MALGEETALDFAPLAVTDGPYRVFFSTRDGGVSQGSYASLNLSASVGDDEGSVYENRRRFLSDVQAPRHGALALLEHGPSVRRALAEDLLDPEAEHDVCDGLFTEAAGISLMLLVADCLPLVLLRRDRPGLAVLHCGWRGLASGIVAVGVESLGGQRADIAAILGPGIGPCCYEVSEELCVRFLAQFGPGVCDERMLDLRLCAERALREAGVDDVRQLDHCTSCDERFFSHRRDQGQTGRQAVLAYIA